MNELLLTTGTVYGRQANTISNGLLQVSVLRGGGHLVELRLVTTDPKLAISPFYVPPYATIDPHIYDPTLHGNRFGYGAGARLTAGYMGHMLCFPTFGSPTQSEIQHGFTYHGEALTAVWNEVRPPHLSPTQITIYCGADLVEAQYRVDRAVTLHANETVVFIEEWIENLASFDRPFNRIQHPTFGSPFVSPGKNMLDIPGTRGLITHRNAGGTLPSESEFQWPFVTDHEGTALSLRPFQSARNSTTYYPVLLDPARLMSYFTLYNVEYPLLIGYIFPTSDNPWIVDWQDHNNVATAPWGGRNIARGIEFGNSPFDEGLRNSVERNSFFATPTYQWIGARQRLKTSFTIFLTATRSGFCGVQDVQPRSGQIVIIEQQTCNEYIVETCNF